MLVLGCIGAAGNTSSAVAASAILARHQPRVLLLMGIAAGIQGKVRIGNVVLSERVVAYEPGALVRKAGKASVEQRPEIDRAPYSILQDVAAYQVVPKRLRVAFNQAGGKIPKPTKGKEAEFRDHVATSITARVSTIASGEKLLRDPSKLRSIREGIHGRAEVGEMEATGVVEACRPRNVPWLVVRGISDFGDEFKDDRFHDFAARAAAAVLVDFLAFGLDLRGREHRPQVVEMHDIVHDIAQAAKRCADIATTVPPALAERSDIVAILKDLGADRLTQTRASHKVTVASPQIGTLAVFAAANLSPTYPEVLVDENHSLGKASREASNVLDDIRNSVIPSVDVLVDTWHDDELKKFGKRLRLLTNQQIMASRLWAMFEKPVEEYCPLRRLNWQRFCNTIWQALVLGEVSSDLTKIRARARAQLAAFGNRRGKAEAASREIKLRSKAVAKRGGLKPRNTRLAETQEEQCVSAYRDVLTTVAALRSAGEQLERGHDWNQAPNQEDYVPTNEAIKRAFSTIEHRRVDTVPSFAEAAKSVVEYWDRATTILWDRRYDCNIDPPLSAREGSMFGAIPHEYRSRVAPGYFKGLVTADNAQ